MHRRSLFAGALIVSSALFGWQIPAISQQSTSAQTPSVLPRPDYRFKGEIGRTVSDSDPAQFPPPVTAPANAPNVVLILLDDVGFGQFGTFGGAVPTPGLDKLANEGLRYNRFHTTAICSPTRAALLTGRNHHVAATGGIAESATGYDGYTMTIPKRTGMVAEVLRQNGYATAWIGKNHNTPNWDINPRGPFDNWPNAWGFDYFYGFMGGQTSQWNPMLWENHNLVPSSPDPNYHLTTDLVDRAIGWVDNVQAVPGRPYFLYLAPGATHAPHQAPKEWIDKFKGKFEGGWDKYREETFERQKKLGVIPADAKLTPRPKEIPAWDSLEPDQKRLASRMMEVFAGFTAQTDYEIGRFLDALRNRPGWENTLVVYIVGDNGSSAEGGLIGTIDEISYYNGFEMPWQSALPKIDEIGGPTLHNHFPVGWAWAMNTPFQWTKQVASHFGGTRNPMVVSWPARIKDKGGLRSQFQHVIDIAPTIYEATGITPPEVLNGVNQDPIEGKSIAYTFDDAAAKDRRRTQYFEIYANRAICHDGWCAASLANVPWLAQKEPVDVDKLPWELYNIDRDFSEADNLAAKEPEKLRELQELWWAEAARNHVLPVDSRPLAARIKPDELPNPTRGLKSFTYRAGVGSIMEGSAPHLTNTSFNLTADLDIPANGAEGMLFTLGGYTAGMGWYVQNGKLVFSYNFFTERTRIESTEPLPPGQQTVRAEFVYDGGGMGKGAAVSLFAGEKKIGEGRIERTVPVAFSSFDGLDVGLDRGAPVDFTYKPPFTFTGKLDRVTVDLK
ncbi:arylsulfatase [Mesorhizobium albiziae]|uniref:Arylsulfatase n=2 Tax=Neomesorhizobium albiziae TaxID=335020 RepID=A0A1I3ZDK7_9HYPH|nr:arylsulfatase [Mesorhizobium albiziae]SFK42137.1 arylsulfatase [Mesorhizobium albiziae]